MSVPQLSAIPEGLEAPTKIGHHPVIDAMARHDLATVEGIQEAIRSVEEILNGFVRPQLHGTGVLDPDGVLHVEMVNSAGHDFPAMLLAALCGYRSGERAIRITPAQLDIAVEAMAPAEACTAFPHPNIAAWRRIAARLRQTPAALAIAVFVSGDRPTGRNRFVDAFARALQTRNV